MSLQIGDKAPHFSGQDQSGNTVQLSDFLGSKLVLFFYPRDNTPGCTLEACNLRDNYTALSQAGYKVLGVSTDGAQSHQRFIQAYSLPFSLVVDENHTIHALYGVWVQKSMFGKKYWGTQRATFVIDEAGVICKVIDKVKVASHTSQIL